MSVMSGILRLSHQGSRARPDGVVPSELRVPALRTRSLLRAVAITFFALGCTILTHWRFGTPSHDMAASPADAGPAPSPEAALPAFRP